MIRALREYATRGRLLAVATGGLGATVFALAGGPLPFLLGPLFACLIASFAGLRLQTFGSLNLVMRTVIGVAAGATITPGLLSRASDMLITIGMVAAFVILVSICSFFFLRRAFGFDDRTSFYCAAPGGLQEMLIFGDAYGANSRSLTLVQATRVLMIVTTVPLLANLLWDVSLTTPRGEPAANVPVFEILLMIVAAVVGWRGALAVGLFGAAILGPMIASGALSLAGILHSRPPAEAIIVAQFVIGVTIGARYVGVTRAELRRDVAAGVLNFMLVALLAAVFAEAMSLLGLAPPLEAFLAFAPGGQSEMVLLALASGADAAFVIVHHVVRLFLVIGGLPFAARLVLGPAPPERDDAP